MANIPNGFLRGSIPRREQNQNNNSMYLAYYANDYSAKNKLEKSIIEYLRTLDRTVVQDSDFKEFTDKVITKIKEICKENSRCKAKNPHLWSPGVNDEQDVTLAGIDVVNFYFYHSTKDYREGVIFIDRV